MAAYTCTWASISPGMTVMPRTSRAAASPARTAPAGPTSTTRSSSTTTVCAPASDPAPGSSTAALRSTVRTAAIPPSVFRRGRVKAIAPKTTVRRDAGATPAYPSSGWRQRSPGNRLKSRSVVIHSLPDSIANAAK